jgi:hypothetical protein
MLRRLELTSKIERYEYNSLSSEASRWCGPDTVRTRTGMEFLWTSRHVREEDFDLWLREIVLIGIFYSIVLAVAYALTLTWRRRRVAGLAVTPTQLHAAAAVSPSAAAVSLRNLAFHVSSVSVAFALATMLATPCTLVVVTWVSCPRALPRR